MSAMPVPGLISEHISHSLLGFSGKRPAELFVDPPNRIDRVATHIAIMQIANAFGRKAITFADECLQRFGPIIDGVAPDLDRIDRFAENSAEDRDQARDG